MKKNIYALILAFLTSGFVFSQGEVEAIKLSKRDLSGTARGLSMGGAFGALGGDLTGVNINPAGLGTYRSSEIVGTLNYTNNKNSIMNTSNNASSVDFSNLGFIGSFNLRSEVVPIINFGFSYNSQYSYKSYLTAAGGNGNSLMDYMANITNDRGNITPDMLQFKYSGNDVTWDPFASSQAPWLSIFGYNSYLINPTGPTSYAPLHNEGVGRSMEMREAGNINSYDFSIGMDIANKLSIGGAISVSDIYYSLSSRYSEEFMKADKNGFDLRNSLTTEGAGVGGKLGIIYKPVNSLRIGVAYHTPIWYVLSDIYSAEMEDNVEAYTTAPGYEPAITYSKEFYNDYKYQTPDKWVFSLAGIIGSKALLSMDYEISNYGNLKFKGVEGVTNRFADANRFISEDHKTASTFRVGMEYRFTPQFSLRLGYAWMQNPYKDKFVSGNADNTQIAAITGSTTIYNIDGDAQFFTGGLGYRFSPNLYADWAIVYKTQKSDVYPYPTAAFYELTNDKVTSALTLGYKF